MYHVWDSQTNSWYMGNYGGLKDIGKLYKTESGAKQALSRYWCSMCPELDARSVEYPREAIRSAGQDHMGPLAQAWRDDHWKRVTLCNESWDRHKHKSFEELFGSRFKLIPL